MKLTSSKGSVLNPEDFDNLVSDQDKKLKVNQLCAEKLGRAAAQFDMNDAYAREVDTSKSESFPSKEGENDDDAQTKE